MNNVICVFWDHAGVNLFAENTYPRVAYDGDTDPYRMGDSLPLCMVWRAMSTGKGVPTSTI